MVHPFIKQTWTVDDSATSHIPLFIDKTTTSEGPEAVVCNEKTYRISYTKL